MECNFSMNPMELDNLEQENHQSNSDPAAVSLLATRSQTLPTGKPPLASEPHPKRRKQPEASSSTVANLARMDSATSSSPRIGTVVQDQDAVRPTMTGKLEPEAAAHSALAKAVKDLTQTSVSQGSEVESQVAASFQNLADLLKDKQLSDDQPQGQQQAATAEKSAEQPCTKAQDGTCAPSPFASAFMGFDPEVELDTIQSGLEGFQPLAPHKPRQRHVPHTEGPLSRAASRQTSTYPGMEHTQVPPEQWHNPAQHPSPRLTAALLRALSTPKAMSATRALSMLYPGLERPEVIEQLQQQSKKHSASLGRKPSEWLSYPGMERGLSVQSQQRQSQHGQEQQAQHAGSMSRHPSDWLSYPGLERGFSVQSRQQQLRSYALSSAESIKRKPSESLLDSEPKQFASAQPKSAQHRSAQQQCVSAFANMAAMPMSREASGQFSYPGMERGFSGLGQKAARQGSPERLQQTRAASMQRKNSDWLSYPGMERGLSVQQPQQQAQSTAPVQQQQAPPQEQQPGAAFMQRNSSDWLSYPGMERGLSRALPQAKQPSPQQQQRQRSPLQPQTERAASMQRNPSDWLSYPGMERGLSRGLPQVKQPSPQQQQRQRSPLQPQTEKAASMQRAPSDWLSYPGMKRGLSTHPQGHPTAAQVKPNAPISRKASECLSYPSMERGLSTQLPRSRLNQALCLETSYSVRSSASDCMWPGLEQCFEMSSNPSSSRLHDALCLETAASFSSNSSDCDWPGLEADFDCCSSPESRLHEGLCLESAASMRSNVSDCYYPGLERLLSMRSSAPALQRLMSIANQTPLQHALCLETSASVRSNLSECLWPGLEQCFAINSPPSKLQQALCLETAASVISNLSDMMLSYPGMESELLYPLSRAASLRSAPAGQAANGPGQGKSETASEQGKSGKAPTSVPAHAHTSGTQAGGEQAGQGRGSSKAGSPMRAWSPSPLSRASSAAKPLSPTTSPLFRLNKAVASRMSSVELPMLAHLHAAKLHSEGEGHLEGPVSMEQD